jgi:hypothetical protein
VGYAPVMEVHPENISFESGFTGFNVIIDVEINI